MFGMDLKTKSGDKYRQEINAETYLKKTNTKRENMEKTHIAICLKK